MSDLRFDNKVVVVTGAGGGLGKEYALEYARRGASVVVNDLGVSVTGEQENISAAEAVVAEIRSQGGTAVANTDSVENGKAIIQTAIDSFGHIDVLINNAGVLRDKSFIKMTDDDWDLVYRVHMAGAYTVTKAAWPYMLEQKSGRIVFTTSAAGLYGNFGQANYGAMKSAQMGFMKALAVEGQSKGIFCNAIAPVAGSRMTETIMPAELVTALKPEYIMPLVVALTHESNEETGSVFEVGAGWMAKLRWHRSEGLNFDTCVGFKAEDILNQWDRLCDFSESTDYPASVQDTFDIVLTKARQNG